MKISPDKKLAHPGTYVRKHVVPTGMTVKDAAKRLGISRPTLSNFLNAKAALSQEMAVRLEKAFGANRKHLIDMQATYDRQLAGDKDIAVRTFVPNFLTIKARQIEEWADSIDTRNHLAVLLRKLVHSTGQDLRKVDFPGYDNSQRKGSDGLVEADAATPWIPKGSSYWEFGANKKIATKAEDDYTHGIASVDLTERENSTFIFVTPRNWPGKNAWEKKKNDAGDWKAVRVYDASDLEQWLEQSVPAQIWLAEQLLLPNSGYETLDKAWCRWANASKPHLTPEIFTSSIESHRENFKAWLEEPSGRPFAVAADSKDEALAFLACLFDEEELRKYKDLAAVFTSQETLRILLASTVPLIPIVYAVDTERALVDAQHPLHYIVIRPRNSVNTEVNISLGLLSYDAFNKALAAMGVEEDNFDRLSRESGRSPTVLRRRLSPNNAIKTPEWASNYNTAKTLVPIALIGAWSAKQEADREIVSRVADRKYEEIEVDIARLLSFDDSPMWSVGDHRGVVSKIDAIFAIANIITRADLDRFFTAAEYILSESDPAFELPEKDRWAAAVYDKTRNHSFALRKDVCETLVILSVHGNSLFQSRLGNNVEILVNRLIRKLLTPLTLERLHSHNDDLPRFAEAAPDEFLEIIEEDMRCDNPVILGLLKPVDSSSFGASPSRTGLLWALECLAWKPQNLPRVSVILAQLSQQKIDDNWGNKPEASLQAIFRSWMPQTAASLVQRIKALEKLTEYFPGVSWNICIEQIKGGPRFGFHSNRPLWRSDAAGAGQVATHKEIREFTLKVLDIMIKWPTHDEKTLGDLVESLPGKPQKYHDKVWDLIDEWSQKAGDAAKATLRERIRRFAFTRRSRHQKLGETLRDRARETYDRLQPSNTVIRHNWLFAEHWVQESIDEIEDDDFDYRKRDERIDSLRRGAMAEIWAECGFEGVKKLISISEAVDTIGRYVASCVTGVNQQADFIRNCLSLEGELQNKAEKCLQGFLTAIEVELRTEVLQTMAEELPAEKRIRLFVCAPFQASTWRLLDSYGDNIRNGYWKDVIPSWGPHSHAEIPELVDRLLEARRPHAAFYAVHMDFKDIETSRLIRLLRDVTTVVDESVGHFNLNPHYISEALESLDGRPGVTRDEMAQLEFRYINVLDHSKHGIPNLESQIAQSPELFVQAIAFAYKRRDKGEDPPEWMVKNPEQRKAVALSAYRLLDQITKIPGTDGKGEIDTEALSLWLNEVRRLCREYDRTEVGDYLIGQLLAKAPKDEDGTWPCEAVCKAMEEIASQEIGRGFNIGVYNSRGVHWRDEGGKQERELASKYHGWAERLHYDYPFVGSILRKIAASYEHDAAWEDSREEVEKRLNY